MSGLGGVTLRTLMLLALVVWIGGIIFFSFVLAPTVFTVLPTTKLAGDVVSVSLGKLHWMGWFSGLIFAIVSKTYQIIGLKRKDPETIAQRKLLFATHILVLVMLALTWISQNVITPKIRDLRIEMASAQGISAEHRTPIRSSPRLVHPRRRRRLLLRIGCDCVDGKKVRRIDVSPSFLD